MIEYSPAQDGSGVVVAPDGTRVGFAAGVTVKDMAAMQIAVTDAHPAPPDPAPVAALQQQVTDLQLTVSNLQKSITPPVAPTPPTT